MNKMVKVLILLSIFLLVLPLAFSLSITNNLQYNLNASKANLSYDPLNRILQKNASTEQFNYSYDTKNGTLSNITHNKGIDYFTYDNKYRIQTESRTINGIIFNKTYTYDAANRIISINLTSGTMLNYSYTNQSTRNNISGIINQTTHSVNNQPINRTYNNSLRTIFRYNDTTLRLTSIETGTAGDIDLFQNLSYSYDNTSNILKIIDNANNMTYVMTYDDLNRVTYANRTGQSVPTTYEYNYSYDSLGNLLDVNGSSANISFTYTDTPVHAPKTIITMNFPPTHETPILNASTGRNITIENLTVYTVDTYDNNFDDTKNIITWYRNSTSLLLLNLPFEGGSNLTRTRDYSGFNNTINVFSTTWFKDEGYDTFGAYNFTVGNTTYMNISYNQTFNVSVWTIEAWVYPHTSYATGGAFIGKWKSSAEQDQWQLAFISGNKFRCGANNFTGFQGIQSTLYAPKKWYHVACTYDGANITLYVNGNKEATANISRVRNNDAEIQIGARRTDQFFNGTVDDVRIWNYSLPWEQINLSYTNRTDVIHHLITEEADLWQANITPNDIYEDGATLFSNTVRIRSSPSQDDAILNSTYEMNWTTENLTVYNTSTFDAQNDQIKNIITWYRNNTPMLIFSSPAEGGSNLSQTKDYGGYNFTINVINASWSNSSGYDGFGAYNFSKNNPTNKTFLNVSYNPVMDITSWTIMAWVYPHSTDPAGGVAVGKFQQWQLSYLISNRFRCGTNNVSSIFRFADSRSTPQFVKKWSHVACVFNGTNLTIYVNGNYENFTNVEGGGILSNTNELQVGCRRADQCFNGSVDDVQIWNGTLTWQQINYSFNNKTNMLAWSMTVEGEKWNASITPNDKSKDGEYRMSKALRIGRLAEIIVSEGTEIMNSGTYNTTLTVINEPIQWLNSTTYNTTLGWTVYG